MKKPVLDELVLSIRSCTESSNPSASVRDCLKSSFAQAELIVEAIKAMDQDEVLLHEDKHCSVWTCRFNNDIVLPPHEHLMTAHIAVYKGIEMQLLYQQDGDQLNHQKNLPVGAREILSLSPDIVHAVTAQGSGHSYAIHVYDGPLTEISRSLFDWTTGRRIPFTMENFHAMKRNKNEMSELA